MSAYSYPSRFATNKQCENIDLKTINWQPYVAGGGGGGGGVITGDPYVLTLGPAGTCGIAPIPANAGASNGRPFFIEAQSSTTGAGAAFQIDAGAATAGVSTGGGIDINAGLSFDGDGGNVVVTAGQNFNGGTGRGGSFFFQTGDSHGSGHSGHFRVQVGSAVGTGQGGDIVFVAGNSTAIGANAGDIRFQSGTAAGAEGGSFFMRAGTSLGGGNAGVLQIYGGDASSISATGNGGSVSLFGGDSRVGAGGSVFINGGNSPSGPGGDIQLHPGNNNTAVQISGAIKMSPSRNQAYPLTSPQCFGGIGIDASLHDVEAPAHFAAYQATFPTVPGGEGIVGPLEGGNVGTSGISSDMAGTLFVFGTGAGGNSVATVTFKVPYPKTPSVVVTQAFDASLPTLFPTPTPYILTAVSPLGFTISVFEPDFSTPLNGDSYFNYMVIGVSFS